MGLRNPIFDEYAYFLTLTVVDWVDVFTRPVYKNIVVDSLRYCQHHKGLELYAWVLMTNHLHLIASTKAGCSMSDLLRDLKKFTSKALVKSVTEGPESRQQWMLYRFEFAGRYNPKIKDYKLWQDGSEPKEIFSDSFLAQKLQYLHNNPVRAGIVEYPEEYLYSSARNYAGKRGLLEVIIL
ncbi:transposase [Larkinella bovis]|uniref:Transposase n=1 Tax=Larkinella bovis TaxID=683041 RepID=A0ABW0I9I9_9BACT